MTMALREPWLAPPAQSDEELHRLYAAKIDRKIRKILGHDFEHEDLVHDVLITVFRKIGTLRDPACMDRWVTQVTINTLKYTLRQRRLRRHAPYDSLPESATPSCQPNVEARDVASRCMRVMEQLPPSERLLLISYWFSAATAQALAAEAGCSVVTVRRRLFRAKTRFERLARRDPTLASSLDDAGGSRRWRARQALEF
jgi:RNA polymerase sigma-70 factor (ECF subfamily)